MSAAIGGGQTRKSLMVHVLRLPLSNVFLIAGNKSVLVDTGRPSDAARICSFVEAHGVAVRDLALIVHTHGHWDHAGSTAQIKAFTNAPIAVHRADADKLRTGTNGVLKPSNRTGRLILPFVDRSYPPVEPDLLFDTEISLTGFGVAARILFTPGHTAGSVCVLTEDKEIITGDLLMGGFFAGWLAPRLPRLHYFAEDVAQVHASIGKMLATEPRIIHTSHGGPLDPRDVAQRFA